MKKLKLFFFSFLKEKSIMTIDWSFSVRLCRVREAIVQDDERETSHRKRSISVVCFWYVTWHLLVQRMLAVLILCIAPLTKRFHWTRKKYLLIVRWRMSMWKLSMSLKSANWYCGHFCLSLFLKFLFSRFCKIGS